jgi:hypothetical protein
MIMYETHREKLKTLLKEILREDTRSILSETEAIITELVREEYLPGIEADVCSMIESSIQEKPIDSLPSVLPGSRTPDHADHEPLMAKIQSTHLNQTDAVGDGDGPGTNGLYVYGIAENADATHLLRAGGIDGQTVYVIPCLDLAAIVHTCPLTPYRSDDESVTKGWVLAHQKVLEIVSEQCGTVIPFGFDTIIMPDGDRSAKEVLLSWISGEYNPLLNKIGKVRGKKEYGVQIFFTVPEIIRRVTGANEAIRAMQDEVKNTSPGKAYMIRQKIEEELKKGIESEVHEIARNCHRKINAVCADIKVGKIKKTGEKDTRMLLNYSCLVSDEQYHQLGEVLESIQTEDGLLVRFTGPWPVYSFV